MYNVVLGGALQSYIIFVKNIHQSSLNYLKRQFEARESDHSCQKGTFAISLTLIMLYFGKNTNFRENNPKELQFCN